MIVLTFNVRGLRGRQKKNKIKELIRDHKVDFVPIQETKMEVITTRLCQSLWGSDDCDWAFLPSEGNRGEILSILRKSMAIVNYTFLGEGFVGVSLEWGVLRQRCVIINVYAKCDTESKRRLWERLTLARHNIGEGWWCILGDFNAVADVDQRRGVNDNASPNQMVDMNLYRSFLTDVELEDHHLLGKRFTWYHANGRAMSRFNRVLISEDWHNFWGENTLWVLPRDVSDHCLLVLEVGGWDWGPRSFRFNNYWLENRKVKDVVEGSWNSNNMRGWMGFVLKEKLKALKVKLTEWNKEEYGKVDMRISRLMEEIEDLDVEGEVTPLNEEAVRT